MKVRHLSQSFDLSTLKGLKDLSQSSKDLRRSVIIKDMEKLEGEEVDCSQCPGTCCTFKANSMQVTPLEALDLYFYLVESNQWDEKLEESLKNCIKDFRLNLRSSVGGRELLRKTYTCPFFLNCSFGCPLPREVKPYGCLGFNPRSAGESEGKSCASNFDILIKREEAFSVSMDEDEVNEDGLSQALVEGLKLYWSKESIPIALLEIHQKICDF